MSTPIDRRQLLSSLLATGAALAAASCGDAPPQRPATEPTAGGSPALTHDHQLVALGTGRPVGCAPPSDYAVREGVPGRSYVMVIDLAACDGCGKCTEACQQMHATPPERQWIRVYRMRDAESTAPYWFPKPCFHCDDPPCTRVCPVSATFKRKDGIVLIDNERCIGCRFCMAACPYSTRVFNWAQSENGAALSATYSPECGIPRRVGTVEKCDFCPDMASRGELPACVTVCEMAAIWFGDANEDAVTNSEGETARLSKLLRDRAGYRYLEELGTRPRVYYLPPADRMYPAPGEEDVDVPG